jgi:hypothetical protein
MKIMSWFATAIVLASCLASTAQAAPPAPARWTVMVYMSGDNNLEDYIVKDIEQELGLAGSTPASRSWHWPIGARLRPEPRRLADDQALLRHPGHRGRCSQRRGRLGRTKFRRSADADRFRHVG